MVFWQDPSAQLSYRDSDSHPRAFGVLTAWLSSERGAKPAALERDRLDVTLKKATPLQVSFCPTLCPALSSPLPPPLHPSRLSVLALQLRQGGIAGRGMYDDDTLDSATDPQVGFDIGSVSGQVASITSNAFQHKVVVTS